MKIGALAPWFGSKRTLAPRIVAELGEHRAYWEPFCGSMAVLLAKDPAAMETVNDLHGDLVNLARVVASPLCEDLHERVRRTIMAHDLHDEAKNIVANEQGPVAESVESVAPEHVRRAYWYLLYSWQGRNGIAGTKGTGSHLARRYTPGGGHGPTRWRGVAESLPAWHARLNSVTIERMDAFEMVGRIDDDPGSVVYADPPYLVKASSYVHDFAAEDHGRLADALRRFQQARVVVSYYDHPELDRLYPGWTKILCPMAKAMPNGTGGSHKGRVEAPEVLLINGPSLTDMPLFASEPA